MPDDFEQLSGPPTASQNIDVSSLLTIDVESELRKLTQAQLQGPWQLPAELVRRALHAGATRVEVELHRTGLLVRSLGDRIDFETLRELAALLDVKRSPRRRHRALSALEQTGALSLLGLVGLEPSSVQIVSPNANAEGETMGLSWERDAAITLQRFRPPYPDHVQVAVRGTKLDRARAREWLVGVARFAPAEIQLDKRPLPRAVNQGFGEVFSLARLSSPRQDSGPPLVGTLALPREGELARLYLLQDGLVTTHMSLTDAPCFEATIEMRDLAEPGASAARLRDVITPVIPTIVSAAIEHMIAIAGEGRLAASERARLTQLLLQAARRDRGQAKTIARLPLFRGLERDGRERWCDLLALRQSIQDEGGERLLDALFPDQDPAEFAPEGRVYVLDESERALLGEILDLGFRQPRRRVEARRGLARFLREGPRMRGRELLAGLRPRGRPLPDGELDPEERHLLGMLRAQMSGCEITMCTGAGPVRRLRGPDKLLLPRECDRVRAAVLAVGHDGAWVYPALLALLDGNEFPERARRRWSIVKLG
jgi:hypothetical protein